MTPNAQSSHSVELEREVVDGARYMIYLPKGYDHSSVNRWPLILFLHGAGERGVDIDLVKKHGPIKVAEDHPDFPFIIAAPQCPEGEVWDDRNVLAVLDDVLGAYSVDESRVYLTGLSMGGYGTWSLAFSAPERFAAAAPVCGGGNFVEFLLQPEKKREALKTLPIWAFHGAKDQVVPLAESKKLVEAVKAVGVEEARLYVFPEADHDSWTETYSSDELYEWFLKHRRAKTYTSNTESSRWFNF